MGLLEEITGGRTDLVFEYLAEGQAATSTAGDGVPLVRWCAYYGDVSAIKHLLANGATLDSLGENFDLIGASFHGHWRLCKFLLERGANPNGAAADTGETPLHATLCHTNRLSRNLAMRVLLAHGANPNAQTKPGVETGSFMRDCRTKGETPLHRAAAYGDEAMIQYLLSHGADREARDAHGDSPLSWASAHLRPGSILALLAFGDFKIGENSRTSITSDHGAGWGNGMERKFVGEFLPESLDNR
jgi:ankyrin repeat protein